MRFVPHQHDTESTAIAQATCACTLLSEPAPDYSMEMHRCAERASLSSRYYWQQCTDHKEPGRTLRSRVDAYSKTFLALLVNKYNLLWRH